MKLRASPLADLIVADTLPSADARGAFARLFCARALQAAVGARRIMQINHSRTVARGSIRGLHFQRAPHAEMKLVRCLSGRVWDVAVDLRRDSSTFLHWYAEELTADNMRMMIIPEGFAHGFQTLEENSELLYLHTALYAPEAEGGFRHDDPRLKINWPLPVTELSQRDASHPLIEFNFQGLVV